MKYFLDTEFIEGFHKPLFGKRRHFIDLISIGIVCEDGRTYSAISNEYKYKDGNAVYARRFCKPYPVRTTVGSDLSAAPGMLIEIDCIAYKPQKARTTKVKSGARKRRR